MYGFSNIIFDNFSKITCYIFYCTHIVWTVKQISCNIFIIAFQYMNINTLHIVKTHLWQNLKFRSSYLSYLLHLRRNVLNINYKNCQSFYHFNLIIKACLKKYIKLTLFITHIRFLKLLCSNVICWTSIDAT